MEAGQPCQKYSFTLTEQMGNILECLPQTQASVSENLIAVLIHNWICNC